jgi:hypothetical protein
MAIIGENLPQQIIKATINRPAVYRPYRMLSRNSYLAENHHAFDLGTKHQQQRGRDGSRYPMVAHEISVNTHHG